MQKFIEILFEALVAIIKAVFNLLIEILGNRENDRLYQDSSLRFWDKIKLFSRYNKGLAINGKQKISVKNSLTHALIVGKTGVGKSSVFFAGNLLQPLDKTFVTIDLDGGLFKATSGYLQSQGYDIQTLDLTDIDKSLFYNPLALCGDNEDELKALAEQIIDSSSANGKNSEKFFQYSAMNLLFLFFRLVKTQDVEFQNISNVRHLLLLIEMDEFHEFAGRATKGNPILWNEYCSFKSKDKKLRTNIEATLSATLDLFAYNEISHLTSKHTIDFERLTKPKGILYLIVAERKIHQNSLLISTFISQLMDYFQKNRPDQPVYFMCDEAGAYKIKNLDLLISILRRYNVSLSLAVQDISQLKNIYGETSFSTIFSNSSTKIVFPSTSLKLAEEISRTVGKKCVEVLFESKKTQQIKPVLTPTEIIQMKANNCLVLHSNRPPALLKTFPYYKQYKLRKRSKIPHVKRSSKPITTPNLIPIIINPNTQYDGFDKEEFTAKNL